MGTIMLWTLIQTESVGHVISPLADMHRKITMAIQEMRVYYISKVMEDHRMYLPLSLAAIWIITSEGNFFTMWTIFS